jgi:hypothetical protein
MLINAKCMPRIQDINFAKNWTLDKLTLNLQGNALRLDFAPIMITLLPGTDFNQKLPN